MSHDCEGSCRRYGDCELISGDTVRAHVVSADGYDWGHFWYCGTAIKEDQKHGMRVEVARDSPSVNGDCNQT